MDCMGWIFTVAAYYGKALMFVAKGCWVGAGTGTARLPAMESVGLGLWHGYGWYIWWQELFA